MLGWKNCPEKWVSKEKAIWSTPPQKKTIRGGWNPPLRMTQRVTAGKGLLLVSTPTDARSLGSAAHVLTRWALWPTVHRPGRGGLRLRQRLVLQEPVLLHGHEQLQPPYRWPHGRAGTVIHSTRRHNGFDHFISVIWYILFIYISGICFLLSQ
jgi:hypothetical protein